MRLLVITDSGGVWYKGNGGRHHIEPLLRAIGFTNIIFEVLHGGTPKDYEKLITAYLEAHIDYLINNSNNHVILRPGFNLLIIDTLNAITTPQGRCIIHEPSNWDTYTAGYCNSFSLR